MKSLWKLAFNSKGFSLTEVMIGGGILAGVALAGAQLFKDQKFAQKRVELDQKLAIFHSQLIKLATDPANCNATIKYYYPAAPGTIPIRTIPTIYECVPGAGNKCSDDNATTADNSFDAYTAGAYGASRPLAVYQDQSTGTRFTITENGFIDNTNTWQIASMRFLEARSSTGTSRLRVTYRMNPNHPKARDVSKDIFFNFRFSGGSFKECLNAQESNVNNLQNDLCKSLNLAEITSTGTMARWDDPTQTCVINGSRLCADGQEAYFSLEGVVKCRKIIKGHEPPALQSPSATPCASPYLQFEGGRVVVKC